MLLHNILDGGVDAAFSYSGTQYNSTNSSSLVIPEASLGTYIGLGLGAGFGTLFVWIVWLAVFFKVGEGDAKGTIGVIFFLIFVIQFIMSMVFFGIGFQKNLLDDPEPAYTCVVETAVSVGSLSMCQSVLTTCDISLSAFPIQSSMRCVQQWLAFVAFYDAVIICCVIGSSVWFYVFWITCCGGGKAGEKT